MGNSAQQIIMKIITEPAAPVTKYRKSVPPHVAAAVAKALEKLPADRFESARAFADALGNPAFALAATVALAGGESASPAGRGGRVARVMALVASVVAVLAIGAAAAGWMREMPEEPFRRYDLALGTLQLSSGSDIAVSPDGRTLALSAREGSDEMAIYVRALDADLGFRKLAGTETGLFPAFSPDGEWIVFRRNSDRTLVKIPVGGGGAVTVVPAGKVDPYVPQWGRPDEIVFTGPTGVFRVPAAGGPPVPIPKVTSAELFPLPDGAGLLFAANNQVSYYDFATDSVSVVHPAGLSPVYAPSGHILYVSPEGGLFAVAFDAETHRVTGTPVRVLERVGRTGLARGYAISQNGVVVQRDAAAVGNVNENVPVVVTFGGAHDTLRLPAGRRNQLRFSPNGRALALEVLMPQRGNNSDIFTLDLNTGTYTPLTFDGDHDNPVWSPDGQRIAFDTEVDSNGLEELFVKFADNRAPEHRITAMRSSEMSAGQWLDDTLLVFPSESVESGMDLFLMRPDSGSTPVPYLQSPARETEPRVSPDRRLLAYASDEGGGGVLTVWLRDFPVPMGKWAVTRLPSRAPRWSPDGRYLYYWRTANPLDSLFRVRVDRTPSVVVQSPEFVMALDVDGPQNWDLHPDGKRFVYAAPARSQGTGGGAAAVQYFILQGWFGELRRLTAPTGK